MVEKIVNAFLFYDYKTKVITASLRNTQHITRCIEIGVDVVTCPLPSILGLLKHTLTDAGLKSFMADAEKLK